jgi:hypothetical protein
VAIMAHGKLQCCGSPLFLKNKFGVGYTLTVVKQQPEAAGHGASAEGFGAVAASAVERSRLLREVVQSFVEEAEPLSDVGAEQSFRLPFAASGRFVELFGAFDAQRQELGIVEYGISVTTLEEVFIRVGEMEDSINELTEAEAEARAIALQEAQEVAQDVAQAMGSPAGAGPAVESGHETLESPTSTTPALHGILHHDHHHQHGGVRGRARSTSSERLLQHPRSSTSSLDPAHGHAHGHGHHKRVSFREGEDERTDLGLATVLTHPPPIKGMLSLELRG